MFNNPLYSGIGKTPFQPATQCSYSVVENVTRKKQVIAMENVSKLCSKHGYHSSTDEIQCDIKSEKCSATIPMEQSIGDERQWAKSCLLQLKEDQLQVQYITTDPDTSAFKAAEDLHLANMSSVAPVHQIDTRHLSQNHRKHIKSIRSLLNMMPGVTKRCREKKLNSFAVDLSMRCQSEFQNIHRKVNGDALMLQKHINMTSDAIIACYQGDHRLCLSQSTVCMGDSDNNWLVKSEYLPYFFKLKVKIGSEKVLRDCIDYCLGASIVEKTKLNSNSQKVESVNVIRHALPKNVTFARNFSGRAHCAVFKCNNGPGEALLKLCEAIAVLSLQIVKCRLDFWPNRNVLKTTKCVVGPQKEKSSVNLGEIIFTSYMKSTKRKYLIEKVSKVAKIRNRYNQVPHLTQDTNGKVTNSQKTPQTRAKRSALSQQVTTKHT